MFKNNHWGGTDVQLVIPPLPSGYQYQSGAMFQMFTFDSDIGDEVALFLLDDPL